MNFTLDSQNPPLVSMFNKKNGWIYRHPEVKAHFETEYYMPTLPLFATSFTLDIAAYSPNYRILGLLDAFPSPWAALHSLILFTVLFNSWSPLPLLDELSCMIGVP